jgi:broad specificity phosphatase PhoE
MTAVGPRTVWFIRHGESVANAGERTAKGATCPLSTLGLRQAEQLAMALPALPNFIVYSTYVRARQTAEPALRRFAGVPVEEWPVQEVQYLDPTLCVDTTQEERTEMAIEYWARNDPEYAAPGAESFAAFIGRARAALVALSARTEGLTYVFCHGHFMRAVVWAVLHRQELIDPTGMRLFREFCHGFPVPNCAILPVYFHDPKLHSVGGLWVPEGIEGVSTATKEAALSGV